ncbi:MAG: hypothetical protein J5679_02830 [Alphaproteobacteria bacterium]|nr:hypothetical protein [Alphaproteobacteria bacterium]
MNYPDDFNVPTFTAGKSIAVSRVMGIGIMTGFLLIICLCIFVVWAVRSTHVEPYILATGGINDQWTIIKPGSEQPTIEMTGKQVIQESLVWKFVQQWFSISPNTDENKNMWQTSCERSKCENTNISNVCGLFCSTGDSLFLRFKNDILPTYEKLATAHEYWTPVINSIRITPVGTITEFGGTWRIQMMVKRGKNETLDVLAYAKVANDPKTHINAKTLGYYIADFNAYRMN